MICFKTIWFAAEPKPRYKYSHKFPDHVTTLLVFIIKVLNFSAINSRIRISSEIPYVFKNFSVTDTEGRLCFKLGYYGIFFEVYKIF